MHLHVNPDSPWIVREAADAVLLMHIGGGTVGIVSGAVALLARKGERLHRLAGNAFFASMLVMAAIGASAAPFLPEPQWTSTVAGVLTLYLVVTSWLTVKRKEGMIGRFELGAFFVPLVVVAADAMFIVQASNNPLGTVDGAPSQAFYIFAIVGTIAAVSDAKVILRHGISGVARIARHLWRMCTALTIASASLFLGQPKVFPPSLRNSPIMFVLALAPLGLMIFWLIRVRLAAWLADRAVATSGPGTAAPNEAVPSRA